MNVRYDQYEMSKRERVACTIGLVTMALVLSYIMYDWVFLAPLGLLAYKPVCRLYEKYQIKRRRLRLTTEFNDFLYFISVSFSLGRTMTQALEEGGKNLEETYGNESLLVGEISYMLSEIKETNASDVELLKGFAIRTDNEDISDFVTMYENCKETGGNIIDAIGTATTIISEKILIEGEIESMASQRKLEGRIIALMPFLIIVFLKMTGPDYISVMYTTLAGRIIMSLTLCSVIAAWLLVDRITRVQI